MVISAEISYARVRTRYAHHTVSHHYKIAFSNYCNYDLIAITLTKKIAKLVYSTSACFIFFVFFLTALIENQVFHGNSPTFENYTKLNPYILHGTKFTLFKAACGFSLR